MSQRRTLSFLAATILLAFAGLESAAQPTAAPIRRIDHIMIRADDPAKVYAFFTLAVARGLWQKLLAPTRSSASSTWQVGDGPAIRLLQARENAPHGLVISVASLPRAKAFLREKGLLGTDSDDEATIDPSKIYGLNIRVVEKAR